MDNTMELTGKAKEDFNKWYLKHIKSYNDKLISNTDENYFNLLTNSMKYGVYVDWFDSVGFEIFIKSVGVVEYERDSVKYYFVITDSLRKRLSNYLAFRSDTRQEARLKAIEKANEIYNNG